MPQRPGQFTRRTVLTALGTGIATTGVVAGQQDNHGERQGPPREVEIVDCNTVEVFAPGPDIDTVELEASILTAIPISVGTRILRWNRRPATITADPRGSYTYTCQDIPDWADHYRDSCDRTVVDTVEATANGEVIGPPLIQICSTVCVDNAATGFSTTDTVKTSAIGCTVTS